MANMSYCRFYNTEKDVKDCLAVLREEYECNTISEEEQKQAYKMIKEFANFLLENELIADSKFDEEKCKTMLSEHDK